MFFVLLLLILLYYFFGSVSIVYHYFFVILDQTSGSGLLSISLGLAGMCGDSQNIYLKKLDNNLLVYIKG